MSSASSRKLLQAYWTASSIASGETSGCRSHWWQAQSRRPSLQQGEKERKWPPRSLLACCSPLPSNFRAAFRRGSMQRQQLPTNGIANPSGL